MNQKRLAEETLNKYFSVQSEEQLLDAYEKIIQEDPNVWKEIDRDGLLGIHNLIWDSVSRYQ
jgi:hypothetical protein